MASRAGPRSPPCTRSWSVRLKASWKKLIFYNISRRWESRAWKGLAACPRGQVSTRTTTCSPHSPGISISWLEMQTLRPRPTESETGLSSIPRGFVGVLKYVHFPGCWASACCQTSAYLGFLQVKQA